MTPSEILSSISELGIELWAENDQLRFRAPKGALTPTLRAQLTNNKSELLSLLQQRSGKERQGGFIEITPAPEDRHLPFPLTDIQQAYWIGRNESFDLGNVATHFYLEIESAELDLERFEDALQQMIARHDMLRIIILPDGQQQILDQVPPYKIAVIDLREAGDEERERSLLETRERMSHQMMKLDEWPLFEVCVSRIDDRRIRLHLSFELLIGDAWSFQIFFQELLQVYEQPDTQLPSLQLSFRDYVLAERSLRESDSYRRAQSYWFDRIDSLPAAPELPLATDPAAISHPRFVRRHASLDATHWQQLKTRARKFGLTPSGVVLAVFAEVLSAWTKTPRFTLNMTLFNRLPLHEQVNSIMGDFTSVSLLGVEGTGATFAERANAIQQQLWKDIEHSLFSGVGVLRELARRYGAQRAAMPVIFTSNLFQEKGSEPGKSLTSLGEVVYSISQTPQVWLDHQVGEEAGALVFNWDAVEDLFLPGMLDDMFEAYLELLRRLSTEEAAWEDATLSLTPSTHLKLQHEVNATRAPLSSHLLHTLFAAQAQRQPSQVAVITSERTLTYQELERRAHQVGHRLLRAGVQRNELVAVVMEKGWEQVVAVLGIHYAGAAYLPVEAGVPAARLAYLLANGKVRIALTQRRVDEQVTWPSEVDHWCVDNEEEWAGEPEGAPEVKQEPTDLAYVIYTSGSTGEPKGVMIDHRGAVNTIEDINERFGVKSGDRVLALSSLSFDLSVYDIFGLLAVGGAVVIPEGWASRDPGRWVELMREHGVSLWNSVPALMQMLVTYLQERGERLEGRLRLALLSGDWIGVGLPEQIRAVSEGTEVISLGGATEASIWSIMYPIAEVGAQWKSIPYGKAMRNQEFYVLDERLRERPVWAVGQLYIGGIGVALGYWGDTERTRERFVEVTGIGGETKRLYRTGDMGRWQGDGNIEFLGREDTQVKVQGYRIELGEVEAALVRHEAVAEAVVVAVGEARGDKRLVAYVVTADEDLLTDQVSAKPASAASYDQPFEESVKDSSRTDLLLDPLARLEFKLKQPGIRSDNSDTVFINFKKPALDERLILKYAERQTHRHYLQQPIGLDPFGDFLSCLLQIKPAELPLPKYRYPSAGNIYPVQIYLYVKPDRVEGIAGGTYYYHPRDHKLVQLSREARIDSSAHGTINQQAFEESAFSIFLIGEMNAITPLYGELSRDFCLLEAGYMSQLLMNTANTYRLGLCPVGSMNFDAVASFFKLGESQVLLHSFVAGQIDERQATSLSAVQSEGNGTPTVSDASQADATTRFTGELRNFLRETLPEYMVPSAFVFLKSMPLTANGKIDRRSLPNPNLVSETRANTFIAPTSELEQTIASIWLQVLHVEKIGVHDNFFDLGGNSVQMVQVHNRLKEATAREISIVDLFKYPTVRSLAEYLGEVKTKTSALSKVSDLARKQSESLKRQKSMMKKRSPQR